MLKIGVDARPLTGAMDGIGRYTRELLTRLVARDDHQWFLYANEAFSPPAGERVHVRVGRGVARNSHVCALGWFPRWARRDRLDVFWSPRHQLPPGLGCRSVVTIHDLCFLLAPQTMPVARRLLERLRTPVSARGADVVACVSDATRQSVIDRLRVDPARCEVVGPGVPRFPPAEVLSLPESYVLAVGTVEPRKNYAALLRAFADVQHAVPHHLVVAGPAGWVWISRPSLQTTAFANA